MRLIRYISLVAVFTLGLFGSASAEVGDFEQGAVEDINYGVVQKVDSVGGHIVINDMEFSLPEVLVFDGK